MLGVAFVRTTSTRVGATSASFRLSRYCARLAPFSTSDMASSTTSSALVARTAAFVEKELAGNDASHDWRHIERVWTVAKRLAVDEVMNRLLMVWSHAIVLLKLVDVQHVPADAVEIVELAALLHDIDDWKYQADHEAPTKRAVAFLESQNVDADTTRRVMDIINSMGFKEELSGDRPVRRFGAMKAFP